MEKKTTEIFVSDKCPHCKDLLANFEANPASFEDSELINITESMANLKRFLKYRDDLEGYKDIKAAGKVGVPSKVIDGVEVEFFDEV